MRLRSSWALIGLAGLILLYAIMRLVEISRNQESVIEAVVFASVTAQEVHTDDEFVVSIHVNNATEAYGSGVKLRFEPDRLAVVTQDDQVVLAGDFFAAQPSTSVTNDVNPETGIIEYEITLRPPADPVSGGGILGNVRMRALRDTTVAIGVTEAQLLSAQIEEVDGQKIASNVESVPVKIQAMIVDANAEPALVSTTEGEPSILATNPPSETVRQPAVSNPVFEIVSRFGDRSSPGVLIGAVFFFIGLVLLHIGLRIFSSLYRSHAT